MKRQFLFRYFLYLIVLTAPCFAKDWNNIFPLKTTRSEVLKILGEPSKEKAAEGEYFEVEGGRIKIYWVLPDCYEENMLTDEAIKPDSVVYQMAFSWQPYLSTDELQRFIWEMRMPADLFWNDEPSCFGGTFTFSCVSLSTKYGFGYHRNNDGVSTLFYVPTEKERTEWKEKSKPCPAQPDQKKFWISFI